MAHLVDRKVAGRVILQPPPGFRSDRNTFSLSSFGSCPEHYGSPSTTGKDEEEDSLSGANATQQQANPNYVPDIKIAHCGSAGRADGDDDASKEQQSTNLGEGGQSSGRRLSRTHDNGFMSEAKSEEHGATGSSGAGHLEVALSRHEKLVRAPTPSPMGSPNSWRSGSPNSKKSAADVHILQRRHSGDSVRSSLLLSPAGGELSMTAEADPGSATKFDPPPRGKSTNDGDSSNKQIFNNSSETPLGVPSNAVLGGSAHTGHTPAASSSSSSTMPQRTPNVMNSVPAPPQHLVEFDQHLRTFSLRAGTSAQYIFSVDRWGRLEHLHFGPWIGLGHDLTYLSENDPNLTFEPAPASDPFSNSELLRLVEAARDVDPSQLWSLANQMAHERAGNWHFARVENITWRLRHLWRKTPHCTTGITKSGDVGSGAVAVSGSPGSKTATADPSSNAMRKPSSSPAPGLHVSGSYQQIRSDSNNSSTLPDDYSGDEQVIPPYSDGDQPRLLGDAQINSVSILNLLEVSSLQRCSAFQSSFHNVDPAAAFDDQPPSMPTSANVMGVGGRTSEHTNFSEGSRTPEELDRSQSAILPPTGSTGPPLLRNAAGQKRVLGVSAMHPPPVSPIEQEESIFLGGNFSASSANLLSGRHANNTAGTQPLSLQSAASSSFYRPATASSAAGIFQTSANSCSGSTSTSASASTSNYKSANHGFYDAQSPMRSRLRGSPKSPTGPGIFSTLAKAATVDDGGGGGGDSTSSSTLLASTGGGAVPTSSSLVSGNSNTNGGFLKRARDHGRAAGHGQKRAATKPVVFSPVNEMLPGGGGEGTSARGRGIEFLRAGSATSAGGREEDGPNPFHLEPPNPLHHHGRQGERGSKLYEVSEFGTGDFRSPSLQVKFRRDGSRLLPLTYRSHRIIKGILPSDTGLPLVGGADPSGAETLVVDMVDTFTDLVVQLIYTVFPDLDCVTRRIRIQNTARLSFSDIEIIKCMSASLDFLTNEWHLLSLHGGWANERQMKSRRLECGGTVQLGSSRGVSSHQTNPFCVLSVGPPQEEFGDCYGFCLLYSGNWIMEIESAETGCVRINAGINPANFSWNFNKKNDAFETPELLCVYSSKGLGDLTRMFHRVFQERLIRKRWSNLVAPVLINTWEPLYFDVTHENILKLGRAAKEAGVTLLVLDDGWFGSRNDDASSLGDWTEDPAKLPRGLKGLAEDLKQMDLGLGIWMEPEMVNKKSVLYRKHPSWVLHHPDRIRSEGRNQLVLDLTRAEVQDYIIAAVSKVLEDANITYLKWDMNRALTDAFSIAYPAEQQGEVYHRYVLGLYRILATVTERFPHVLFESCASGGGRFDAGLLHYCPQTWTSDNTDAFSRTRIQIGTSLWAPVRSMGAHITTCPNHQTQRTVLLKTRFIVALFGTFGLELDLTKMNSEELREIRDLVVLRNSLAPVILHGVFYRLPGFGYPGFDYGHSAGLTSANGVSNVYAWMCVEQDQGGSTPQRAVVMAVVLQRDTVGQFPSRLRLRGLNPQAQYRLREHVPTLLAAGVFNGISQAGGPRYKHSRALCLTGSLLMNVGLPIHFNFDGDSALFELVEVLN
ncbi:unnamed protein product [Amoebophrya sp. A25]|nr:unnamed protein product [Amoebophrya sp. A25]|eukprot:GSA25T00015344001.1